MIKLKTKSSVHRLARYHEVSGQWPYIIDPHTKEKVYISLNDEQYEDDRGRRWNIQFNSEFDQ
jgi:hypothetical protein